MLEKKYFKEFIENYNNWNNYVEQLSEVLTGHKYSLFEYKIIDSVNLLYDNFIESHFTEEGSDLIYWWQFEDVPKEIYDNETTISVETLDELWNYIQRNPKVYLK